MPGRAQAEGHNGAAGEVPRVPQQPQLLRSSLMLLKVFVVEPIQPSACRLLLGSLFDRQMFGIFRRHQHQ